MGVPLKKKVKKGKTLKNRQVNKFAIFSVDTE